MWQIPPLSTEVILSLVTLASMEIVLGIDNVIFLAILVAKLPKEKQPFARRAGLVLALISRLALLFALSWIMRLTKPLFSVMGLEVTGQKLILIAGGLFLMGKAIFEIHEKLESKPGERTVGGGPGRSIVLILIQIAVLDIVFSLDSVITAVGMAQYLMVMVVAMVIAVGVMLFFAAPIGNFVMRHPTMKMLALAFLMLIGFLLVAEGLGKHVPKGYIYFAMAFSLGVELLNMKLRKAEKPVVLHEHPVPSEQQSSPGS